MPENKKRKRKKEEEEEEEEEKKKIRKHMKKTVNMKELPMVKSGII